MTIVIFIIGLVLILTVLWDAFETVVLPRRVTRRLRLVRLFYRISWPAWAGFVRTLVPRRNRENALSYYGPLSFLLLLVLWAIVLIAGFGLWYFSLDNAIKTPEGSVSFDACLYFSATTFFTLGLGDIQPLTGFARALIGIEAGMGFGFLALVISYLPAIHQSFARREVNISLLDARAGSPPTAGEILRRNSREDLALLTRLLHDWERWSAELLESHLSFPMLVFFRSQHDNQSWLAALASILDTSSFAIASFKGECVWQARLTFAMARHTLVDLALVLHAAPVAPPVNRLGDEELAALRGLVASTLRLNPGAESAQQLQELRGMYEGYLFSLSARLLLPLPPWLLTSTTLDNWQISAWGPKLPKREHF